MPFLAGWKHKADLILGGEGDVVQFVELESPVQDRQTVAGRDGHGRRGEHSALVEDIQVIPSQGSAARTGELAHGGSHGA
ncbi:MAG: hypothetical protein WDM77_00090 [Steroidobacteraceae bacterium]